MQRPLLSHGMDTFIRFNESVSIYDKVKKLGEQSFANYVSYRKPFGLPTTYRGKADQQKIQLRFIRLNP